MVATQPGEPTPAPPGAEPATRAEDVTVSVVICAYSDARWEALVEAVESVRRQGAGVLETIVVVDHNPALLERVRHTLPDVVTMANSGARGLAGARNTGVAAASGSVVAFLDDDAVAEAEWIARLVRPYEDPRVIGTGGTVRARWLVRRPSWFPAEFDWVVGCSYRGLPREMGVVRNPIGANMSFRREVFHRAGGFREGIGRIGRWPVGCEETELSIRAHQRIPGARVMLAPAAAVDHQVPPERATVRYFVSRCFAEGFSKALVAGYVGAEDALASERQHVTRQLRAGVARGLRQAMRGDADGLLRAGTIIGGLATTAAGYALGRMRPGDQRA